MAEIIYGSVVSKEMKAAMKEEIGILQTKNQRLPKLVVLLVGDDPASHSYVKGKEKACKEVGMLSEICIYEKSTTQTELIAKIDALNEDPLVDGILVQLPLPKGLDTNAILWRINPEKDVDGLHPINVGKLHLKEDGMVPCTPSGIIELLSRMKVDIAGKKAVVLGRSNLVGSPIAQLLCSKDATVTICHSKTKDIEAICRESDIVIAAVGKAKMVKKEWIKPGAAVIDVGVNRNEDGKLVGDVDFEQVQDVAAYLTPVPKGVGPMTITMLLANTLKAYKLREKQDA